MKEKIGWPGVLGVVVVLGLLLAIGLTAAGVWSVLGGPGGATWAAWVQAVGSVAALFVTGGLAAWEASRRRVEDRLRAVDHLRARLAVLEFACSVAESFLEDHESDQRTRQPYAVATYEGLKNAFKVSDLVTVLDMPTKQSVNAYFSFTATVAVFRNAIMLNDGNWLSERDTKKLRLTLQGMLHAVAAIWVEANRLEKGGE